MPNGVYYVKVKLYDARGVFIEEFDAEMPEALERIAAFVKYHGFDPEEDGKGAMAGTIKFTPIKS